MRLRLTEGIWRLVHRWLIQLSEQTMPQSKRGRAQDRAKVAVGQAHEVRYEADKIGAPKQQVQEAVKDAGNSRKAVERQIGGERKGPKRAGG
jgi:hypothetical protein